MNSANDPAWSGGDPYDPQAHDFDHLLNLDNLDNLDNLGPLHLDFGFQDHDFADHNGGQHPDGGLAKAQDGQHVFSGAVQEHHGGAQQHPHQHQHQQHGMGQGSMGATGNSPAFYDFSIPFSANQSFAPHAGVPPTPNSTEFHGNAGAYGQHMQSQVPVFDHDFHMHKDDPSFTPLVSPAVTPFDIRSQLDFQTIAPGAYFSPLTSPALTAQNHQNAHIQPAQYTSGSSADASPLDIEMSMDIEMGVMQHDLTSRPPSNKRRAPEETISPVEQPNTSWKGRRASMAKSRRQNSKLSNSVTRDDVGTLTQTARDLAAAPPASGSLEVPRSNGSSDFDSVSPERLSDMGPPPLPGSVTHSPATFGPGKQSMCPATPASLMHIHQTPTFSDALQGHATLEDLELPEASMPKPPPPRDDGSSSRASTSSRKTPKLTPLSTPSADVAQAGKPSPMLVPGSGVPISPMTPAFAQAAASKRGDPKSGPRTSKKRGSIIAPLVSPAIMPKVSPSPNIKPLTSDVHGHNTPLSHASDAHTLLLASKSNYQNIIDGTTIPGVSYPASLATNLTSKRTSHKLAEQGRRNRINTALTELQALLPAASPSIGARDSPELAAQANANAKENKSNDSKAAKVESAIDYIKQLQKEAREKDRLMEEMRREMAELRKKGGASEKSMESTMAGGEGGGEVVVKSGDHVVQKGKEKTTTEAQNAT